MHPDRRRAGRAIRRARSRSRKFRAVIALCGVIAIRAGYARASEETR